MGSSVNRRGLLKSVLISVFAGSSLPALAHHGWSWADGEQMELNGTIQQVSMAPPHPTLTVKASDGRVWRVELSNPNQTARSGFTAKSAKPGDAIVILGNRNRDKSKAHMKAVRITIGGKNYDIYPERIIGAK
ncbi:MAG: hypothetical protein GEU95_05250 [Rhizobiales bacterium]|nr:hypothetical protein [Hyphomicrobiales bacterium]